MVLSHTTTSYHGWCWLTLLRARMPVPMARASLLSHPLLELQPLCFLNFSFLFVFLAPQKKRGWRGVQPSSCSLVALPRWAGKAPSSAAQAAPALPRPCGKLVTGDSCHCCQAGLRFGESAVDLGVYSGFAIKLSASL